MENMSDQSSVIADRVDNSEMIVRNPRPSGRIASLDLVRGVAMILMAIDHVRVYSGIPAWGQRSVSSSHVGSRTFQRPHSYSLREHPPTSMRANSKRLGRSHSS